MSRINAEEGNSSSENSPLISIITVVFNGEEFLEDTIQSVLSQDYKNIEYIIIDGGSTDGTVDIIKKHEGLLAYWISEPDKGIYDAMNKGITLASGGWIHFMNSGDSFYNNLVVTDIFCKQDYHSSDVIFGDHQVIYPSKNKIFKAGCLEQLWKGSQFCHQSCFVKSSLQKEHKFNILNRIGADFEFFYSVYKKNKHFQPVNIIISSVSSGGVSDLKRIDSILSWWNVVEKNNKVNFYYLGRVIVEIFKKWIKICFSSKLGKL